MENLNETEHWKQTFDHKIEHLSVFPCPKIQIDSEFCVVDTEFN